jgi:RNA polymerase sigma factor (sigma-70 family)
LRVGSRLGALRDEERFRSYLCTTIVSLARTQWRRDNRRREVGPAEMAVEQPDLAARDEMLAAILRLPVKQRAVVFLRYYLDMSEADAARTLDVSLSAVKSLNHRALSGLRRELEEVRR